VKPLGRKIPHPDPIYGDDCNLCTPARFPIGETPAFIFALFENIVTCHKSPYTFPGSMLCKMYQQPGSPCHYKHKGTSWTADLFIALAPNVESFLSLADIDGWVWFVSRGPYCPAEFTIYENEQFMCLWQWAGSEGTGIIYFDNSIKRLTAAFGLTPGQTLFLESFSDQDSFIVQKFCDLHQRTNIKFKTTIP
jgi:hypothetical protein